MNYYVRYFMAGVIACVHINSLHAGLSQKDVERRLTSYHNAAFGDASIVKKAITTQDINNWNMVAKEVEDFAKKNALPNMILVRKANKLAKINAELVPTIVEANFVLFRVEPFDIQKAQPFRDALQKIIDTVDPLKVQLQKDKAKKYTLSSNQAAVTVLHRFAVTLSTTAKKALKELM